MKHISRRLLALLAICLALTACARLEPPDVLDETTGGDSESAWKYTPSDDAPAHTNMRETSTMPYYGGGFFVLPTLTGISSTLSERDVPGADRWLTLRRIDVETGAITDVCPDPLCLHCTPSCPFAGMNHDFFVDNEGNLAYYRMFHLEGERDFLHLQLCTFNLNTMEWRIHIDSTTLDMPATFTSNFISHNGYLYYSQYEYVEQEDGEKKTVQKKIRENIETGKKEELDDTLLGGSIVFVSNNRIYVSNSTELYSTDLALGDKQTVYDGPIDEIRTNDQYIFFAQSTGTKPKEQALFRMDMDGSNLTDLDALIRSGQWTITQNYIYYQRAIPEMLLPDPDGSGAYTVATDAIMRCDLNGENHEEIFVFNHPDGEAAPHYRTFLDIQPVGNYVYAAEYGMVDENRDGKSDRSERYSYTSGLKRRITRIDITTGEVTYVCPYEDYLREHGMT